MTDEQRAEATTPSKVILSSPGISVSVESHGPLGEVATQAQRLHRDLAERYGSPPVGPGFGGTL